MNIRELCAVGMLLAALAAVAVLGADALGLLGGVAVVFGGHGVATNRKH